MKLKKNLVLLGMMGSGKTSIGLMTSKKLQLDFIDIDIEIENQIGMKISKIFEVKGEKYFREVEEKITLKNLEKEESIISLGGGGFLNNNIKKEVLKNHYSFWLNWNYRTLIRRINNSKKRPLAFGINRLELIELIKKRSNIYSKALYKIDCEKLSKTIIVNKITKIYETNKIKN
tara:strand:- start:17753 stop:18277 length:525 start_codon:yes stop_codon:yes gene_type:complete